jgi:hypothetical protein
MRMSRKSEMNRLMNTGLFARSARNAKARSRGTSIGIEAVIGPTDAILFAARRSQFPNIPSLAGK